MSKLFVLLLKINTYLCDDKIIPDNQFGFRKVIGTMGTFEKKGNCSATFLLHKRTTSVAFTLKRDTCRPMKFKKNNISQSNDLSRNTSPHLKKAHRGHKNSNLTKIYQFTLACKSEILPQTSL